MPGPADGYFEDGAGGSSDVARLSAQVAALQGEQEMRGKLEKLLEVQTVQVDLQKELRMKTESLLQVEQQTSLKLRQQLDQLMRGSKGDGESEVSSKSKQLEDSYGAAQDRIKVLEHQLTEARAPETSDRIESHLRKQLEEQEQIIKSLRQQMEGGSLGASQPEGEVVRLQLLLQSRDKHLDELSKNYKSSQDEAAEARYEADVLKHQVGTLRAEVLERNDEIERQLNCERNLRAEIFSFKDKLEKMEGERQEEKKMSSALGETAVKYEEAQKRMAQIEAELSEEKGTSRRDYNQLAAESEQTIVAKEQIIKHQTTAMEALNRELKEKQAEIDKLLRLVGSDDAASPPADPRKQGERGGLLPPMPSSPKPMDDMQVQRSLESLHKQLKAKDGKIAKQSERLQALTEMLEQRDSQLQELSTARRDREQMRQRLADMEDAMKAQPRVVSHAEAERRLIQQETKLKEHERQAREVSEGFEKERSEKDALSRELSALRGRLAQGASSSGALESENERLSKELAEHRAKLEAKNEEAKRLRDMATESAAAAAQAVERQQAPEALNVASLPSVQRRLQKLEETDKLLGRDVLVYLQERESKIEGLNSTVALLRKTVDELQTSAASPAAPRAVPAEVPVSSSAVGRSGPASPTGVAVGVETDVAAAGVGIGVGRDSPMSRTPPPPDPEESALAALGLHTGVVSEQEVKLQRAEQAAKESERAAASSKAEQIRMSAEVEQLKQQLATAQAEASMAQAQAAAVSQQYSGRTVATNTSVPASPSGSPAPGARPGQPPPSPRGPLPPLQLKRPGSSAGDQRASPTLGLDATRQPGFPPPVPQGAVAANAAAYGGFPSQMPVVVDDVLTTEDLRTMSAEQIRNELIGRRGENHNLEYQLEEKKQLVMKLIEETNLCNAEVASLKQTLQQAFKGARKREREIEELAEQKAELEQMNQNLENMLTQEKEKYSKLFREHQQDHSGNETVDQVDREVTWKLKVLAPRQHEVRNSVFLVINRRSPEEVLDKQIVSHSLAQQFGIPVGRIEVLQDALLPDSGDYGGSQALEMPEALDVEGDEAGGEEASPAIILVNIADSELNKAGEMVKSAVSALDVLEQVRSDMLRGHRLEPLDGLAVDAVFINHGDIVLPFEWPAQQARLLLREGRVVAGKHAVITIHEVSDPYVLRVVAYDTEAGHEFMLHLYARDVALLLDTRDCKAAQEVGAENFRHLEGPLVTHFRHNFSVAEPGLLDIVVDSLNFSVFQHQKILVASEMRLPLDLRGHLPEASLEGAEQTAGSLQLATVPGDMVEVYPPKELVPLEAGATRGLRPVQRQCKCLFEEVLSFEGRTCVFSLLHTTSQDLEEDLLRAVVYYPKTCAQLEVSLVQPMESDRLRIVAEAAELDSKDCLSVGIVVEEIIYPPAFVIRLTSITLNDAFKVSPQQETKPHSHIIRVSKDGASATHLPDMSFALSPSTMRQKLLSCIGLSTPLQGPREEGVVLPDNSGAAGALVGRIVTGHVNDPSGLRIQLVAPPLHGTNTNLPGSESKPLTSAAAAGQPAAVRAQLRAKYGKGKQLARRGVRLQLRGGQEGESVRCVVTVFERPEPYHHFIVSAYEPQTSKEWEVLADSIDVFRLFTGREEGRSPALDLNNPAARMEVADILLHAVELQHQEDELLLSISATAARQYMAEKQRQQRALRERDSRAPEVAGGETTLPDAAELQGLAPPSETLPLQPASTNVRVKAVVGFSGGIDRETSLMVEQRGRDRLLVGQRRLSKDGIDSGELYKIQIFDAPLASMLHSYIVLATPLDASQLAASGIPVALPANPEDAEIKGTSEEATCSYMLKVDDKSLEDLLWGTGLLEPSRQEELLTFINQSLCLDKDRNEQLRLCLRKRRPKTSELIADGPRKTAMALTDHGAKVPASHASGGADGNEGLYSREIGGSFPLVRLKRIKDNKNQKPKQGADKLKGPSLIDQAAEDRKFLARDWQKLHQVEQHWGGGSVVITVSKRGNTIKISAYEPKSSSHYEMCLATKTSSSPLNILIERVELTNKLDLLLCMYEIAFPHQVTVVVEHIATQQEFRLNIGDDEVYTMIENSRKDAFTLFMDQLIHCGCVGGGGAEETALATVFEETFAGNQVFGRTIFEDGTASLADADLRPTALAPQAQKKQRVPVIRTQLDYTGNVKGDMAEKNAVTGGLTMTLLYHAEHIFPKEGESLMLRVHKRLASGDIAFTLRTRGTEGLGAPEDPQNSYMRAPRQGLDDGASGRPFETPVLTSSEAHVAKEVTIWLQDKCSYAPCGCYGEIVEVPGFSKQVAVFVTDEDSPRAIRVAVVLAQLPFTVLFQAVLLENSESHAKVELSTELKQGAGRKVMKSFFERSFNPNGGGSSVLSHLAKDSESQRQGDLRKDIDNMNADEGMDAGLGMEHGEGTGGPIAVSKAPDPEESLDVSILYMCTRRKLGRMMVFTIFRDLIAHHMYLRVVMHDPHTGRDCHLTLLHYTTQRLLAVLRINRDMLEEASTYHTDAEKTERQKLRTEVGKIIVNHLYLRRKMEQNEEEEVIDDLELLEEEDVEYQLRMREIMDPSNVASLSSKTALLDEARESRGTISLENSLTAGPELGDSVVLAAMPKTLLEMSEEHLLFKGEQDVGGRRVLVVMYSETTKEDILKYSHNLRVVVACVQTLEILAMADFHEDTIELVCARRNKRHLMSACREHEMAEELYECMVLQRKGQQVTGINFQGQDG
mmetsp:Transcript_20146/g.35774  ORF Transcript_20146/g.35774 Transcript_20146/m.35774 type:complete len:2724 (+) Transcript_20146:77-8248(+)